MVKGLKDILVQHPEKKTSANSNVKKSGQSKQAQEFEALLKTKSAAKKEKDIQFSSHAMKRIRDREIEMDNNEFLKLREAFRKLQSKGGQDSLVVTDNAAYILDVKNAKVVTAVDKDKMSENVFTKIDSTIFIN
jgi:flagellar operon protein